MHRLVRVTGLIAVSTGLLLTGCKRDPNVQKQKYLESGKRYEKDGKLREAAIQFSNALKVDHNFAEAYYQLGKTYIEMGNVMAGYNQLLRAVDLGPSNLPARIELGNVLAAGGAPDRALVQAKAVLAIDANNADAYALLARLDEKKGDHVQAAADIRHALAIDPKRADFHTELAVIETISGQDGGSAEQELQKAVSLDPKSMVAHLVLAGVLEKKGDLAGAEQQDQLAVEDAPKNLQAYLNLGSLYMREGKKDKAEQTLLQATDQLSDTEAGAELMKGFYDRTGQSDRVPQVYAGLVAKHPKSIPLKIAYAKVLETKGDYAQAAAVVDDLSKKNGGNPQVELLRTLLLLHDGKTDEAYTLLQKATKNAPDNQQLLLMEAQLAMAKGDLGSAQAAYTQVAHLDPASLQAQAGLADIANQRKDYSLLAQVADKTISLHPELADGYLWRGTAEANQKQDGAEADFETAIKKSPDNATGYLELGELRLRAGHVPEGKALLEQALQHNPSLLPALQMLVSVDLSTSKDPGRAKSRIEEQIAKAPKDSRLYAMLAGLDLLMKDYAGARDQAAKAIQLAPANEEAVQTYTQALVALGNTDQAVATWKQWVDGHPNDAGAVTQLGELVAAKGDANKAMDYYRKALQIDPTQPVAENNLAYLMVENGQNVDVALSLAQAARRSLSASPSSADTLAWVYYYKGTYGSARDLLEDALKTDPNNAAMHYHLGMIYTKLNDKSDAEVHLKKAVSLAPNSPTARQAGDALTRLG
jgi:tetratricopeptide (TPR) repeat protein